MRCAMCFLERDESRMRLVLEELPVKVCGQCSMALDKARGFFEFLGLQLQSELGFADQAIEEKPAAAAAPTEPDTAPQTPQNGQEEASRIAELGHTLLTG